jgi:hypothetical protein
MRTLDRAWILAALFAVTMALWDTPFVYPVKVLVVLFHEISHGVAALLTGGSIERITLSPDMGGLMTSLGGIPLVILPAGYLGSMACGAGLVLVAAWSSKRRLFSFLLGAGLVLVTLVYVRSLFGFLSGLVFGILLCLAGARLSEALNDLLLSFLGLTSMLYALLDIRDDLISRTVPQSDAYQFSKLVGLPPVFWGLVWGGAALVLAVWVLLLASGLLPGKKKRAET